ncbi:HxsD-like protein [uncultured Mitsuokella sp.]|uniref:HxsD-like protein n=2 Tax=Mitsuokella TaxID=52225 RepID=UPI00349FE75E
MNDSRDVKKSIMREYPQLLYPRSVIEQAVSDYAHICRIDLQTGPQVTICRFYDSRAPLQLTVQEFSNYLIELINKRGTSCLS